MQVAISIFVVVFTVALAGCGRAGSVPDAATRNRAVPEAEAQADSALFQEFETVFYVQADMLSGIGLASGLPPSARNHLSFPFYQLTEGLRQLASHAPSELIPAGSSVLLGAKEFKAPSGPTGLGDVRSTRCYVIISEGRRSPELERYFFRHSPVGTAQGSPVWNWSAKLGEFGDGNPRESLLYITRVGERYVLVANGLEQLQAVAARLVNGNGNTEELKDLQDWLSVRQHHMWGYRNFRFAGIIEWDGAGLTRVDHNARALEFWVESDGKSGTLRMLNNPGSGSPALNTGYLQPMKPVGPDASQTPVLLTGDQNSVSAIFVVEGLLGFAVYL